MRIFFSALKSSFKLFTSQRRLWLPFLFVAAFELLIILVVWMAPHAPLNKLLSPPIRFFFGDRVLHYPAHMWFLYHTMKHAQLVAMLLVGAYMTGVASLMVEQVYKSQPLSMHSAMQTKRVKYGRMMLIWIVAWGLGRALVELGPKVLPQGQSMAFIMLGLLVLFQSFFLYAIPYAALQDNSWWRSLLKSILLAIKNPVATLFFVFIPSVPLVLMGYFLSSESMAKVVFQTIPELVFIFIFIRFAVWTIADTYMSVAAAHVWMLTEGRYETTRAGHVKSKEV